LGSLIWNNQTTLAQAKPEPPAKAPSRPRRVIQRFPSIEAAAEAVARELLDTESGDESDRATTGRTTTGRTNQGPA